MNFYSSLEKDYPDGLSPLIKVFQIFLLILIIVGIGLLLSQKLWVPKLVQYIIKKETPSEVAGLVPSAAPESVLFDGKNATFVIDGVKVTLIDGISEVSATADSASRFTTRYFGNEAEGDLTGDGYPDVAFLVTQETGGSGIFYYVVVAIREEDKYVTTNAFFIGDRIAPQSTYIPINSSELQVNYAERRSGEPMTTPPSVGATLLLKVTPEGVLEGLMN